MRELKVLGDGHLNLRFSEWKESFEDQMGEQVRCQVKRMIEQAFREVRRRTRPMSSFSNVESCDRIIFCVISHLNRSWEKKPLSEFTQDR